MCFVKIYYYFYSLIFCLRYLPLKQAIKIPILIWPFIKIGELHRGSIVLKGKIHRSMIILGFKGSEGRNISRTMISIHQNGKLILGSRITIAKGSKIIIDKGSISIDDNFCCNSDCFFCCNDLISIGKDNMYGWNVSFNTTDGHYVYTNNGRRENHGPIIVGSHVWIASNCSLSKNSIIADDCVIAQNSLVTHSFNNTKCLIGGIPAKEIKKDINWTSK